ncbi:pyridoxine/pyridoxamine 5'-phosphate oxidase [Pseudonocardia sp. GCM10023141]|uniref:pyridoxine/pyridoxamine 5'-phosphate oxidase n=1 Tax=Pseudonocardia sp. GCM10023141 TaxID=3252653 RepID=UPI00361B1086
MADPLHGNPLDVLARWVAEATAAGLPLPSTTTLATADGDGMPHARTVDVTAIDATGLRFQSSTPTGKSTDLAANPRATAVFHWPALGRQAVFSGATVELDAATSRTAFRARSRQLQLVAWAYEELLPRLSAPDFAVAPGAVEQAYARAAADPGSGERPPSWTTFRLVPTRADLWQVGTETTPQTRTRFVLDDTGWRHFPVLP